MNRSLRIRLAALLSCFLAVAFVFAAGQTCKSLLSSCTEPSDPSLGNGTSNYGCNSPNSWSFGPAEPFSFFLCNGKSPDCERTGDNCNIMVEYDGLGRVLTCVPAGWTVCCMVSVTSYVPLNIKCDDGTKCNPNGPTDTIPSTIPSSGHPGLGVATPYYTWNL
jgi:hypothetical protein